MNWLPRYLSFFITLSALGFHSFVLVKNVVAQAPSNDSQPVDDQGHLVRFSRDIAPILVARCLECHGPKEAKNDFRVDDRDNLLSYIVPKELEGSSLWSDYLVTSDSESVMPPTAKGGPLTAGELALLRTWIQEGASWPEGTLLFPAGATTTEPAATTEKTSPPASLFARVWAFQGYLHPATVHFPVALLCVGALFVVAGWLRPELRGGDVAYYCLILGAVSAVFAAMMGWAFAYEQGYGGWTKTDNGNLTRHRWFGVAVAVIAVIFALIALKARKSPGSTLERFWKGGLLLTALLVSIVGHQGGELTYQNLYEHAFDRLMGGEKVLNTKDK